MALMARRGLRVRKVPLALRPPPVKTALTATHGSQAMAYPARDWELMATCIFKSARAMYLRKSVAFGRYSSISLARQGHKVRKESPGQTVKTARLDLKVRSGLRVFLD